MPILETPPNPAPLESPLPDLSPGKIRTRQFGELDHTELVHLLDSLDDERARARFRESIYISLFVWIGIAAMLLFLPRYLPREPRFVTPGTKIEEHQLTHLDIPPDVKRALEHAPQFKAAPKAPSEGRTPEIQQPASPAPAAPQVPPQQQAQQPAAPPPQQPVVQESPLPQPRPAPQQNAAALPSAPAPSNATRPNFGNPATSARDMVQQAGRAPRGGSLDDGPSGGGGVRHGLGAGAEILSDTQGVDFNEYLKKILTEIRSTWEPLIPEEARPPLNKQGETQIRFIILPDGRIGGMALEWSTHDDAINKSCWGSITGVGQFPPLPSQFHGPNLELRIHYLVNKEQR